MGTLNPFPGLWRRITVQVIRLSVVTSLVVILMPFSTSRYFENDDVGAKLRVVIH